MKTKTFILLAICYFIAAYHIKAQAYIPFAKDGKMWTEKSSPSVAPMYSITTWKMQGDTIINGKLYKIVTGTHWYDSFFIYEDTALKKVYCLNAGSSSEFLLYDFNLQIGDTLAGSDCLVVVDKTVEYFAGKNRIKISFNDYTVDTQIWYEGIGSLTQGVFLHKCITGGYEWLLCYFENDTLIYHNSSLNNDCFTLNIQEFQQEKIISSYFSNNILYIKPTTSLAYALALYDIFGRKIKEATAVGDLELNLSGLHNGLYIYRVESSDTKICYSSKLVLGQ